MPGDGEEGARLGERPGMELAAEEKVMWLAVALAAEKALWLAAVIEKLAAVSGLTEVLGL